MDKAAILTHPTTVTTDNPVENMIAASQAFCEAVFPGRWVDISDATGLWCDIGALWNGTSFTTS